MPTRLVQSTHEAAPRSVWAALRAGFGLRCPHCHQGKLLRAYLKVVDRCPVCGEAFYHHRADDAPAYFTILIVGHVLLPLMLIALEIMPEPQWVHFAVWPALAIVMTYTLLPRIKGALVALQWALRMHGFGTEEAIAE